MLDTSVLIQAISTFAFAVIVALVPVIIKALFPQIEAYLKAKAHGAAWQVVIAAAGDIVAEVEQARKSGLLPDNDVARKWAVSALHTWLISRGIDLPLDQLVTAVESAVHDLPRETPDAPAAVPTPKD